MTQGKASKGDQHGIPCAYIRGGTSKALFFKPEDIPAAGPQRDAVLKRIMGSPDPLQSDGMGGRSTHTSKIAIVSPSAREDADVDFTFCQVGIEKDGVSYAGNCGNISSGVGPFAIDEGLVKARKITYNSDIKLHTREVRIFNTGTKTVLLSHVPVDESGDLSVTEGNSSIAGVPGSSAPVFMDYRDTVGATLGRGALPSGNPIDKITLESGRQLSITVCDVANISIFVAAEDVGITGHESAKEITSNAELMALCKEIRGKGAQLVGMCKDWEKVDDQSPGLPFVVLVSSTSGGKADEADIAVRLMFMNKCHDSLAGTGAICTAACSQIPSSVVRRALQGSGSASLKDKTIRLMHPEGVMPVWVDVASPENGSATDAKYPDKDSFKMLAFIRTSRRIMSGTIYVPKSIWDGTQHLQNGMQNGITNLPSRPAPSRHILMTGDINLLHATDSTIALAKVESVLHEADAIFSNLECMLGVGRDTHSVENEGFFADPEISIDVLRRGKISAVGIANNINYGEEGIMKSIAELDKHKIPHAGAGANINEARKPVEIECKGRKYGFLQRTSVYWPTNHAANDVGPGVAPLPGHTAYESLLYRFVPAIPPVNRPGIPPLVTTWVDETYLSYFVADIKALRPRVDTLIASCHWGLGKDVLKYMEQIAYAAIDAGADIVMGHGPHQPLAIEIYKGKAIFYGLGSFVFQTGHLGMKHGDWVGLLARMDIQNEQGVDGEAVASFRFVRHSTNNESFISPVHAESGALDDLRARSKKRGVELVVKGDEVFVMKAK